MKNLVEPSRLQIEIGTQEIDATIKRNCYHAFTGNKENCVSGMLTNFWEFYKFNNFHVFFTIYLHHTCEILYFGNLPKPPTKLVTKFATMLVSTTCE